MNCQNILSIFVGQVFVHVLITKLSGIPMLETGADKKWGGQEDYENYKKNTPMLVPFLNLIGIG